MFPEVTVMSKFSKDLAERVAATAAFAGVGVLVIANTNTPTAYTVVIAAVLSLAKGWLAKFVGNADSASLTKSV